MKRFFNKSWRRYFIIEFLLLFVMFSFSPQATFAADKVNLEIGDRLLLGIYNGQPIEWQIYKFDDGNPVLISKYILSVKAFDAAGDDGAKDDFYSYAYYYGSNQWSTSSLRDWLNSTSVQIDWTGAAPNAEHVFNGENAYAYESGFLHSTNMDEKLFRAIIESEHTVKTGIKDQTEVVKDRVYLLSTDEYLEILHNELFYPLMLPTEDVVKNTVTLSFSAEKNLKMGNPFAIWTNESVDNPYATHAVKTIDVGGEIGYEIANASHAGVVPVMKLNKDTLLELIKSGDGSASLPYVITRLDENGNFEKTANAVIQAPSTMVLNDSSRMQMDASLTQTVVSSRILMGIGIVVFAILFLLLFIGKKDKLKLIVMVLAFVGVISVINLSKTKSATADLDVVVLPYTQDKQIQMNRLILLSKTSSSENSNNKSENNGLIVINDKGENITEALAKKINVESSAKELEETLNTLLSGGNRVVFPGDYRVVEFAKEVAGVMQGTHLIQTREEAMVGMLLDENGLPIPNEATINFKTEIATWFEKRQFDKIKVYLTEKQWVIRHPSDFAGIGIALLYE